MKRLIKTKIKRLDESSFANDIEGSKRLQGLDREAPWSSIKWYPETDTREIFISRCISVRGSKNIKEPKEKSIKLCSLLWTEFTENESTTNDIATKETGLKSYFTRRDTSSKDVSGQANLLDDSLDYLLHMDFVHLTLEQAQELNKILKDIEAIGSKLNASHMFQGQASGSRKQAMRKYYRLNKVQILMKRQQLKHHISNVSKKKKKEIMAKSDRTETGRKKKKNFGAKNHLNEFNYFDYVDYGVFEASRGTAKRARFVDFLKPLIERKKSFSKLDKNLEIITSRGKKG